VLNKGSIKPKQDHIICEHPHSKHLHIAAGGSYHSWEFLPMTGKYVAQMIEGTLDHRLVETLAWDWENKGSAHEGLLPRREIKGAEQAN
jgi:sarcosine oxidase/L-pipecolate oxidase